MPEPLIHGLQAHHLAAAVLLVTLLELLALSWARRRGVGLPSRAWLLNLLSGACLLAALYTSSVGADLPVVAGWLLLAGVLHAWDLKRSWRRQRRQRT